MRAATSISSGKGQTLSVNTLIVVALGILILIIGVLMYNKFIGGSEDTLDDCRNQNGICTPRDIGCDGPRVFTASCPVEDEVCCLKT